MRATVRPVAAVAEPIEARSEWWLFAGALPHPQPSEEIDTVLYEEDDLVALEGRRAVVAIRAGRIMRVLGIREGDQLYARFVERGSTVQRRIIR